MTTLVIDPVTRIEGHLRIELDIAGGAIAAARSSGTSFRGFENIMRGHDPRDAAHITQRICGVCPIPHARAASEAFERAAGIVVSEQARLIRNIVQAANFIDSHLLHFYALALPDFVTGLPTAVAWQQGASPKARPGGERLDAVALAGHVAAMLQVRRHCHALIVALAGKMPHAAGIIPGGATVLVTEATMLPLRVLAGQIRDFVAGAYAADVAALAAAFPAYEIVGASQAALLAYGAFPAADGRHLLSGGLLLPQAADAIAVDVDAITESSACARYTVAAPAHPADGTATPALDRVDAYSWIKAPRMLGLACEVGPLARAVLAGRDPGNRGVMVRHRARQGEASILATAIQGWLDELRADVGAMAVWPVVPDAGSGVSLTEGPRGALGHWVTIEGARVSHYGIVTPTTWNASPRDDAGLPGPLERSLEGVMLADPTDPIEAIRIVHSYDPCLQCAVH